MAYHGSQQASGAASSTIEVVVDHQHNSRNLANGNGHESSPRETATVFEPGLADDGRPSPASFSSRSTHRKDAPEKKLTLFALRLAMLEKSASSLGALGFIWATVVLLGGFAIVLDTVDFWVVTTILVIEGARIFSRSHELEWQHQATRSIDSGPGSSATPQGIFRSLTSRLRRRSTRVSRTSTSSSFPSEQQTRTRGRHHDPSPPRRAWKSSEVPFVPYVGWVLDSTSVSRMLYWLQLVSASTCVALSLTRLSQQSFGEVQKGDTDKRNRKAALDIFYGLALAEALLFLIEKLYWEFEISVRKLLEVVSQECGLGDSPADLVPIRRFFFDAFSRCIEGSIFDGAKMELVSFAEELLGSDSRDEQLIGARILCQFAGSKEFGRDTLRKIGTSTATMERLVEMLNWKSPSEAELRLYAAEVVSELASKKQNVLRVAGIPGSMESIASLLANINTGPYSSTNSSVSRPHEVRIIVNSAATRQMNLDEFHYDHMRFNLLGLSILKRLAHNHENCGKIGNTRDLLPRIIQFTAAEEWLTGAAAQQVNSELKSAKVKAAKRSLRLLQMLANASGATGKLLRREIADIVFTIGNMRDIVRHGGEHRLLQKLAIEILTCLTLDVDARERIGATGGVIPELFRVFFEVQGGCSDVQNLDVGLEAGEALAMLALENRDNCRRMLRLQVVDRLTMALRDTNLRVSAGRILTNLCTYADADESFKLLRGVTKPAPMVLQAIVKEGKKISEVLQAITTQEKKTLEVSIGLAVQIFRMMSQVETEEAFKEACINQTDLVMTLIEVLKYYKQPSVKEPRMRKYVIELMIWMMKSTGKATSPHIITAFKAGGIQEHLQNVADTTSELELYNVFSGMSGLSRHEITIESLVETAMSLLSPPLEHKGVECVED